MSSAGSVQKNAQIAEIMGLMEKLDKDKYWIIEQMGKAGVKAPDLVSAGKIFCRHCGMSGGMSGYCAGCSQGRQVSSSVFQRCVHCGRDSSDDSLFCTNCGWRF